MAIWRAIVEPTIETVAIEAVPATQTTPEIPATETTKVVHEGGKFGADADTIEDALTKLLTNDKIKAEKIRSIEKIAESA